tara:strand:- start:1749 stop:2231 length:483 start_codon:yes stop_codon:yes gene_type:complete
MNHGRKSAADSQIWQVPAVTYVTVQPYWGIDSGQSRVTMPDSEPRLIPQGKHMSDNMLTVTDDSFDADVLGSDVPVLVDFWAEWCGPCKMIAPVLEEIADEYAGKLKIAKLNIDQNEATAPKFGIRSIPTLILFKNGNAEATKIGAMSKSELTAFIEQAL